MMMAVAEAVRARVAQVKQAAATAVVMVVAAGAAARMADAMEVAFLVVVMSAGMMVAGPMAVERAEAMVAEMAARHTSGSTRSPPPSRSCGQQTGSK